MIDNMNFSQMTEELTNIEYKLPIQQNNAQQRTIIHGHANGSRTSIQFKQKLSYTIDELLIILNILDNAWEAVGRGVSNFTYIQ